MLEALKHTWLGGFLVYIVLGGSWTLGPVFVIGVTSCMADWTYGLSFGCVGCLVLESFQARRLLTACVLALEAYLGPRNSLDPGFLRYWVAYACMFLIGLTCYGSIRLRKRPKFTKLMQDLDFTKYHSDAGGAVELRGALDDVQKSGSLFGFHPHGILSAGFAWNGVWSKNFAELAGTDVQFMIDKGLREDNFVFKLICDLHGGLTSLNKKSLTEALAAKTNVAFIPGGFQDATLMEFGCHRTAIKKRTGFIKYALQHGSRVHACYTFGECETHYTFKGLLDFRLWLNGFGIPAVVMFGFPLFPLFPRPQAKLMTYIGKAIEFPRIGNPSPEDVKKWHQVYIDALIKVFEENKAEAGVAASARLEIW
jgi:2-acylglycerol O-acyltransferase 2